MRDFLEAPPRIELGNEGFADLCLTAWLWCLMPYLIASVVNTLSISQYLNIGKYLYRKNKISFVFFSFYIYVL